jgi:hypothetical protein
MDRPTIISTSGGGGGDSSMGGNQSQSSAASPTSFNGYPVVMQPAMAGAFPPGAAHPLYAPDTTTSEAIQAQAVTTPWTLGSTDGTFATSLFMWQQQQQQAASQSSIEVQAVPIHGGDSGVPPPIASNGPRHDVRSSESQAAMTALAQKKSLYQDRIFRQPSTSVEAVLAAGCEVMGFDIAEMWLRTGAKTHQLTNSHLRPTALEDSVRKDLVDVYYGDKSSERTHRLSPALCKRAKEANDVVWVTAHTPHGAEALRCSISNVRTAVAVPVCHEASNTNITIIFFSIRR